MTRQRWNESRSMKLSVSKIWSPRFERAWCSNVSVRAVSHSRTGTSGRAFLLFVAAFIRLVVGPHSITTLTLPSATCS